MSNAIIKRYKEQRDLIRKEFQAEKVGNQTQFTDQLKLFKPLMESQKETSKDLQDKLASNQSTLSNALVPFTNELKRRNDQVDELQALPFYSREESLSHSTPKSKDIMIDINGELLNQTQKDTLEIYERKIKKLQGVSEFIVHTGKGRERKLCKQKRGKGRPRKHPETIFYNSANDLCEKLDELVAAKRAGNTGLDNSINSVLDELLNIGAIDKNLYNNLFKHIF